jgi:hypothetical protein
MMSQRDEVVSPDTTEQLYWLHNPVRLERLEESREEAPSFHLLARLVASLNRESLELNFKGQKGLFGCCRENGAAFMQAKAVRQDQVAVYSRN